MSSSGPKKRLSQDSSECISSQTRCPVHQPVRRNHDSKTEYQFYKTMGLRGEEPGIDLTPGLFLARFEKTEILEN